MTTQNRNKGGRPRLDAHHKRTRTIAVRFSPPDYMYVKACADECGLTPSEFVYRAAMNQPTTVMLTSEEMRAIADIRNVGNNLNQITRCMHLGMDISSDIQSIIGLIASVIHKVR